MDTTTVEASENATRPNNCTSEPPSLEATSQVISQREADGSSSEPGASGSSALNTRQLKDRRRKKKLKIKSLEKKLELLDRHIKRCNEAELSMEEMESGCSAYMKEDLYKRKFVATWQELCAMLHIPDDIEVVESNAAGEYSGTPFPEINRRVERLLKVDEFPDYIDIVELIERCDTKYTLGISSEEKSLLSRKIFKEVGKLLKDRRQRDFISHFGSHLTDVVRLEMDPALEDVALSDQLKESSKVSLVKMEELCEEFVVKQEQESGQSGTTDLEEEEDDDEIAVDPVLTIGDGELNLADEEELDVVTDEEADGIASDQCSKTSEEEDSTETIEPPAKKLKSCNSPSHSDMMSPLTSSDPHEEPVLSKPSVTGNNHEVICLSDDSDDDDVICVDSQ